MLNKKCYIFFILTILLLFNFNFNCKANEKEGYVQLNANVDDRIKEGKFSVEVGVCEVSDDGLSKKIFLHEMNGYKLNVALPEGHYEINYAKVVDDDEGIFWFSCDDIDFVIKKDSPAVMYFGLGDVLNIQNNQDNQEDEHDEEPKELDEEVNEDTLTKEEIELLKKMGLDIYNEDGTLNEEKISEQYEEKTGETINETMEEYNESHPIEDTDENNNKKEKEKGKVNKIIDFFMQYYTLILAFIVLIAYFIYWLKTRY